jgi:hypothetical protein
MQWLFSELGLTAEQDRRLHNGLWHEFVFRLAGQTPAELEAGENP